MRWDLFCRVVDNHGDAGVAWRLARDLAGRDQSVCLWIDDRRPLDRLAPGGAVGVEVRPWSAAGRQSTPGDVVIEAFGCALPAPFVQAMAAMPAAPLWINLEYLSAESYVERSHRLPSPQFDGPGAGLTKWFFFPGFTPATGGLLREPGLLERRAAFDRDSWLASQGLVRAAGQRLVSLFCYEQPLLPGWLDVLAAQPLLLLVAPCPARAAASAWLAGRPHDPWLQVVEVPWLDQAGYDQMLWACDLNIVRGEDSFVRAQWAGAPFLWHIYPQHDGVHATKLEAFVDRLVAGAAPPLADAVRAAMRSWNGLAPPGRPLPEPAAWRDLCHRWRDKLVGQDDLSTQLLAFCRSKRRSGC